MQYKTGLFIFRRDLRLNDNTGLIKATKECKQINLAFIFDDRQKDHKYFSDNAFQFMLNSLVKLIKDINDVGGVLNIYHCRPDKIDLTNIDCVYINKDYTPFSKRRDLALKKHCTTNNVNFVECNDILLTNPDIVKNKSNQPFKIFTHYYKFCNKLDIPKPNYNKIKNINHKYINKNNFDFTKMIKQKHNCDIDWKKINWQNYNKTKDYPKFNTTHVSKFIKFGIISIRELYWFVAKKFDKNHEFIRQLFWHDFYTYIAYHHPIIFTQSARFNKTKWQSNKRLFDLWCLGKTGFPIIDAGIRELNNTGFMHNRVRMLVASFLIKDLHIDWHKGEQYFANKLIDYDPSINNGNWQWVAGTGFDAMPYFRIFNPWLQQKKFDIDCDYIKKWIPELKDVPNKDIHMWHIEHKKYNTYIKPIINHEKERNKLVYYN